MYSPITCTRSLGVSKANNTLLSETTTLSCPSILTSVRTKCQRRLFGEKRSMIAALCSLDKDRRHSLYGNRNNRSTTKPTNKSKIVRFQGSRIFIHAYLERVEPGSSRCGLQTRTRQNNVDPILDAVRQCLGNRAGLRSGCNENGSGAVSTAKIDTRNRRLRTGKNLNGSIPGGREARAGEYEEAYP